MQINDLWNITMFAWGVVCACAVIAGFRGRY